MTMTEKLLRGMLTGAVALMMAVAIPGCVTTGANGEACATESAACATDCEKPCCKDKAACDAEKKDGEACASEKKECCKEKAACDAEKKECCAEKKAC